MYGTWCKCIKALAPIQMKYQSCKTVSLFLGHSVYSTFEDHCSQIKSYELLLLFHGIHYLIYLLISKLEKAKSKVRSSFVVIEPRLDKAEERK